MEAQGLLVQSQVDGPAHRGAGDGLVVEHQLVEGVGHRALHEYYGAAEPQVRCGESHLSGLTEPPRFVY